MVFPGGVRRMTGPQLIITLVLLYTGVKAVTIQTEPTNTTALSGTNASIPCVVANQAFGEDVQWKRIVGDVVTDISTNNILTASVSKYSIEGTYNLTVINATLADEGAYECSIKDSATLKKTAYLTVGTIMSELTLYWPGNSATVQENVASNLTCRSSRSKPAASFRWLRGNTDITNQAYNPAPTADNNGLYTSYSIQSLTLQKADAGTSFTCIADISDLTDVKNVQITVQFSGGTTLSALASLIVCTVGWVWSSLI